MKILTDKTFHGIKLTLVFLAKLITPAVVTYVYGINSFGNLSFMLAGIQLAAYISDTRTCEWIARYPFNHILITLPRLTSAYSIALLNLGVACDLIFGIASGLIFNSFVFRSDAFTMHQKLFIIIALASIQIRGSYTGILTALGSFSLSNTFLIIESAYTVILSALAFTQKSTATKLNYNTYLSAYLLGYIISTVVTILIIHKSSVWKKYLIISKCRDICLSHVSGFAAKSIILNIIKSPIAGLDILLCKTFFGDSAVGILSFAKQYSQVMLRISNSFSMQHYFDINQNPIATINNLVNSCYNRLALAIASPFILSVFIYIVSPYTSLFPSNRLFFSLIFMLYMVAFNLRALLYWSRSLALLIDQKLSYSAAAIDFALIGIAPIAIYVILNHYSVIIANASTVSWSIIFPALLLLSSILVFAFWIQAAKNYIRE